jgi:hypothetical protein
MTAMLVLLALLSVATLASRPGVFATFFDHASTPLLVFAGLLCAPGALGVMPVDLVHQLRPALAVGVTWLGVLTGLRAGAADGGPRTLVRAGLVVAVATAFSVLAARQALLASAGLGFGGVVDQTMLTGAALIIGGALSGAPPLESGDVAERNRLIRAGELGALFCAVLALVLLPSWSTLPPSLSAALVVGAGLLLALLQRLAGGGADGDAGTRTIAILGLVTLAAGLLHNASLPSAVAGLVAGTTLARTNLGKALRANLEPTHRPARIVVVFLVGVGLDLTPSVLVVGALLATAQLIIQLVATSWAVGHRPSLAGLAAGLTSSPTPLVLAASYALAGLRGGATLLAIVTVAVVATDVAATVLTVVARLRGPRTGAP